MQKVLGAFALKIHDREILTLFVFFRLSTGFLFECFTGLDAFLCVCYASAMSLQSHIVKMYTGVCLVWGVLFIILMGIGRAGFART